MEGKKKDTEKRGRLKHEHQLAMICICSSTSGLKLTDCTNVVASKYFRWQDLCQAVGGVVGIFCLCS